MVAAIDYDILAAQMLPSAQRLPQWITFARVLLSQNKRLGGLFVRYMNGSDDLNYWSGAVTYGKGDLVKDLFGVFESKTDSNTGNALSDTTNWLKVLDSFIGANERAKYNAKYLTLTYALNRIFGTTFRQPPYPAPYDYGLGGGVFSDIYITNTVDEYPSFLVDTIESGSDNVSTVVSSGFISTIEDFVASTHYEFDINMPIALYTSIGGGAVAESVVRKFVDRFKPAGIEYNIVTY